MPFDGSGNYTPAASPNFPAISGQVIASSYYNNVINDIASALSNCLTRDGQGRPSAAINWNAKNLTNVATFGAVDGNFNGALTAQSLTTVGNATVGGNLSVTGSLSLSTPLPVASGGTGVTTSTGTGSVVLNTNPSFSGTVNLAQNAAIRNSDTAANTMFFDSAVGAGSAGGDFQFRSTAGLATRMYIRGADGNVGIGTTGPLGRLHVRANTDQNLLMRGPVNLAAGTSIYSVNDTNGSLLPLEFGASSYFFAGGNVGIGATSPGRPLTVRNSVGFPVSRLEAMLSINPASLDTGEVFSLDGVSPVSGLTFSPGDARLLAFGASPNNRAFIRGRALELTSTEETVIVTANTERLRVTAGGNVGIGTSTPGTGTQLNVAGRGLFTGGSFDPFDGTASGVSISYDTVNNIGFVAAVQTGVTTRQLRLLGNPITFFISSGAEAARITATGALAIGSDGADFGRAWRFVAAHNQNARSEFGFINNNTGASASINLSRIGGIGNSFCDWSLSNNGGAPIDSFDYGAAVTAVRWLFNSVIRFQLNADGSITSADRADAVGYKGLPQNAQGSGYTLVLADQGKHVTITGGVTIPANASVAFPIGTTIVIYNNSASNQTISITSDTLRLAGTATTGARTLAQRGLCTLVKVGTTEWVATGNVT